MLILVWFERSLHSAQVSEESCPGPLKLMTSQWVERTWIRTGGYGRFRGEWVNRHCIIFNLTLFPEPLNREQNELNEADTPHDVMTDSLANNRTINQTGLRANTTK